MFSEFINKFLTFFLDLFEEIFDDDKDPKNYVEIDGVLIEYEL